MGITSGTPALNSQSRVFIIEGGACQDHEPEYLSCAAAGAFDQSLGDIERVECPDPNRYGEYIEVASIRGADDRATSDIVSRYPIDRESQLGRIAKKRCTLDVQVHFGVCQDPKEFNDAEKVLVWENVDITSFGLNEVGSMSSDANGTIEETAAISMREWYEIIPISFTEKGQTAVTNPVIDVVICDSPSCGDCTSDSDGCKTIFAVDDGATGSPGTAPDVLYSTTKGQTWTADDVSSLASGEAADGLACLDEYLVVVSNADGGIHYKTKSDVTTGVAGGWTRTAVGIVATGEPNDIWSVGNKAFAVGDLGYIYSTTDPTSGVTLLDAGEATSENLHAVHAINDNFAVAVGENGAVVFTTNGTTFGAASGAVGDETSDLESVWVKNEKEWWVGGSVDGDGNYLFSTIDGGVTFTAVGLPGTGWTEVHDIAFASKAVGRIAADKSGTPKGWIVETWDAGNSWTVLPRGTGAPTFPANDSMLALAVCPHDVNFVVGVGTGDNATDGIILIGQD